MKHFNFYPVVDLHASWLVLNPIQGCPNRCKYCFMQGIGLTGVKPVELVSPEEAVEKLSAFELYDKNIPLCIFSQTDAFSCPSNIEYLKRLIKETHKKKITNPKIFITKCKIPDTFLDFLDEYRELGEKFVFFLSFSGLDNQIETGINHDNIKNNFKVLKEKQFPIIHYWRPFIPQNSSKQKIDEVIDFVKKYALASVAIGLKVQDDIIENFVFWQEILKNKQAAIEAESIWQKDAYDYIWNVLAPNAKYQIFHSTSCALSFALEEADRNAFYQTEYCMGKYCNEKQRLLCDSYYKNVTDGQIREIINQCLIKIAKKNIKFKIDMENKKIKIDCVLTQKQITYLTQKTKMRIACKKSKSDYYWSTSTKNAKVLKIN